MKLFRNIAIAATAVLMLAYFVVSASVSKTSASGTVWIPSSRPNGDISVSWKGDSFDSSTGTYTATFHVHNNRSYWIQVNPKWLQNFCTNGAQDPCLDHQSVVPQGGVGIQGNNGADITLTTNIYQYLNYHVVNPNCGTYQYDFFFTTNGGEYFGTTDLHTTWAAAMWKTNNTCVAGYPTPTPTPPSYIIVKKFVNGGPNQPYDFWMHINTAAGVISFPGSSDGVKKQVQPGSYQVTEDQKLGYEGIYNGQCSGTINAGQTYECDITNKYNYPHITVVKHVVGGPLHASDFTMHLNAINGTISFPGSESGTSNSVFVGPYGVTESTNSNYRASYSGACDSYAQAGMSYVCYVTNTYVPGPTPTMTPIPTDTPVPTATPTPLPSVTPTATPIPTNTPVPTATPTPSNNNNCDNSQNNNGGDANNNCNNNNNNQSQNQTQNNNQSVNITYTTQVLGTSTATSLPSTGTPISDLLFLGSMLPAGLFLRKRSK